MAETYVPFPIRKRKRLTWLFPNPPKDGQAPCAHTGKVTGRYMVVGGVRDSQGRLLLTGQNVRLVVTGLRCTRCNAFTNSIEV